MATPENYIAALLDFAGLTISEEVRKVLGSDKRILDIGAGWGKYRYLLPEYEMDALDIWGPYVEKHKLDRYYRNIFIQDASEFVYPQKYGAVIMGDVLEHLDIEPAKKLVKAACMNADYVFIATPFEMVQHEVEDNPHEAHAQDDLTEKVMADRYPELKLFKTFGRPNEHIKAIYIKKDQ